MVRSTLKVRHSSARSDVHGVIVRPNATLEIAESNAMLNGQINLYGGTLKIDDNVSVVSNGTEMYLEAICYHIQWKDGHNGRRLRP